ncbi:helix-turn-helix domain-containing protein [Paraburkholderia caledonica]|jgi:transcriptional regulator with XRE-family HTH domain|uniref:helix-turn-helix domain-containing protein n=1 Tax=Paraburkholderia caledonica TaxID=134536 RepID=UPI000B48A120|nr:hypothetical protein BWU74_32775 [Burkholderia sp. Bk]
MLNTNLIAEAMATLAMNQSDLAAACDVSRESVSNWLQGESLPRPKKLRALAEALQVEIEALLTTETSLPEPVVAYRSKRNQPVSDGAIEAASELARHLRELARLVPTENLFSPAVLQEPSLDEDYVCKAAAQTRERAGLSAIEPVTRNDLIRLHALFGSILIPVLWGEDRVGHENALSVYLPETKSSWVVFSLNARSDDFNYWLAHELAHCYTLHALQGDDGERFAERFAQELLFPQEIAKQVVNEIKSSDDPMAKARFYATAHDISIVTVIRQIDCAALAMNQSKSGLENDDFWAEWNSTRSAVPTIGHTLFGSEKFDVSTYVTGSEKTFGTPFFKALAQWQREEGGRSPAFVASAMNVSLRDAVEISHFLSNSRSH